MLFSVAALSKKPNISSLCDNRHSLITVLATVKSLFTEIKPMKSPTSTDQLIKISIPHNEEKTGFH